jgi:plastocyanin
MQIALISAWGLWGCSKEEGGSVGTARTGAPSQTVGKQTGYQSVAVQSGGTIVGKVVLKGRWTPSTLSVTKDQSICGRSKTNPSLLVSSQGEIHNAVVFISDIATGKPANPAKAVIDQKGCAYVPHVLAFPVGTALEILNSDGILHNVHSYSTINTPFNRAQPKYVEKLTETFTKSELISIRCDVHGWMSAWLFVTDHPYYAVTLDKGAFKLADVPSGDYTLEVWHEKLGNQSKKVTVGENATVQIDFEFAAPAA